MKTQIILIGGFCEMIEHCQECGFEIIGIVDVSDKDATAYGLPYLENDEAFLLKADEFRSYPLVITPDAPKIREKIVARYREAGFSFAQVVSPSAKVSRTAKLGEGVVIQAGCMISAQTTIGNFVRMNMGARVFHESVIGDFVTLAPDAFVGGKVKIGKKSYIGMRSVVMSNKLVGSCTMIGAGAVVTKDVETGTTVAGVPARKMGE
jgi:sugar O-acyltransferase (sialic acid O-acetyltransferase NeuD family)